MRFAIASEGKTDFIVLKNLLMGFFKNNNLPITLLRPKKSEPFGWSNLLTYISSKDFRDDCEDENIDYTIIQIDTNECAEWIKGIKHIGDDAEQTHAFIEQIKSELVARIGKEYFDSYKEKIFFAICVHEVECWLLPFNATQPAHSSKMVNCANTLEKIIAPKGLSIHQKNYQDGKNYDNLSKGMKHNKTLIEKSSLNPSLSHFVSLLTQRFPAKEAE